MSALHRLGGFGFLFCLTLFTRTTHSCWESLSCAGSRLGKQAYCMDEPSLERLQGPS